jgi:hypothetical protein
VESILLFLLGLSDLARRYAGWRGWRWRQAFNFFWLWKNPSGPQCPSVKEGRSMNAPITAQTNELKNIALVIERAIASNDRARAPEIAQRIAAAAAGQAHAHADVIHLFRRLGVLDYALAVRERDSLYGYEAGQPL